MTRQKVKRERSVDWSEVVFSLNSSGKNTKTIAENVGVSPQSVAQWRDGVASPTYDHGVSLMGFWMMNLKLDYHCIPRIG